MLIGNFEGVSFATGVDTSLVSCFFYAGVLAFADGLFPLKISAIASSHHRTDLPLAFAAACGGVTKTFVGPGPDMLTVGKWCVAVQNVLHVRM